MNTNSMYMFAVTAVPFIVLSGAVSLSLEPRTRSPSMRMSRKCPRLSRSPRSRSPRTTRRVTWLRVQGAYYSFSMIKDKVYTVTMVPGYSNNDSRSLHEQLVGHLAHQLAMSTLPRSWQDGDVRLQAPFSGTNYVMVNGANDAWFGIRVTSP